MYFAFEIYAYKPDNVGYEKHKRNGYDTTEDTQSFQLPQAPKRKAIQGT